VHLKKKIQAYQRLESGVHLMKKNHEAHGRTAHVQLLKHSGQTRSRGRAALSLVSKQNLNPFS